MVYAPGGESWDQTRREGLSAAPKPSSVATDKGQAAVSSGEY